MQKSLSFLFAILICNVSFSQNIERITVKASDYHSFYKQNEYKYPLFTRAKVYFSNGDSAGGKLNFNYFDQSMRFVNEKGDTVAIANEQDVNLITIGTDTFFYDNGFYEWVASSLNARLAAKHLFKLAEKKTIGAFGTSSPAVDIQKIDKLLEITSHDLQPNEELTFTKETTYYVSHIKGHKNNFVVANKNNLSGLFPKKNVPDFIKENKLNLNKEEDLVDVFIYVNKSK